MPEKHENRVYRRCNKVYKSQLTVAVLGLPPSFYDKQTIQNLILNLYSYDIRDPRGFTVPMPQKIEYIPQGTGIYYSHVSNGNADYQKKNVVIIDIGVTHTLNTSEIIEGFVTDQLVNIIEDYAIFVKGIQETVDYVLLGSGGATYLTNYIRNITIVDEPQLANAK